ncbi:peptidase G2, partial [Staphylococcus epidermidis]
LDIRSIRSYNIRHIGHHKATDAKSKTAYNVTLNNCVALYPQYNGAYEGATPRALVVCAYRNVNINNFTAIGDGNFMAGMPVIVVQYRAENVNLNNIN